MRHAVLETLGLDEIGMWTEGQVEVGVEGLRPRKASFEDKGTS